MHDIWKDMFVVGLPILEKILRPIFVYIFLIVGLRAFREARAGAVEPV